MRRMALCGGLVGLLLVACGDDGKGSGGEDTGPEEETDDSGAADGDGDGYSIDEDCDDRNAAVNPGAAEVCNDLDDDCDGLIDDADDSVDLSTGTVSYTDSDGDGYGDPATGTAACTVPSGAALVGDDCDDSSAAIRPDATEVCDGGVDNDCDGRADDADDSLDLATAGIYYADGDGDGYGDAGVTTQVCSPSGSYVSDSTDCDDSSAAINPGAVEQCNGVDDDCDSTTGEEGTVSLGGVGYRDLTRALAAARSGDTVTVCEGTYVGAFTVPDGVTLASMSGAASTVLEGDGLGTAAILTLEGEASLIGLTLTGGSWAYGGAVDAYSAWGGGDILVEDCIFDNNVAVYGGGLLMFDTSGALNLLTVVDSTFSNNLAYGSDSAGTEYGYGGAVYVGGDMDVSGSSFDGNIALSGGGILIEGGTLSLDATSSVTNNAAYANTAGSDNGDGGGISASSSEVVLDDALVDGNYADLFGGGAMLYTSGLEGGTFSNNETSVTGGGFYAITSGKTTISGVTVQDNAAAYAGGAMLHTSGTSAALTLEDTSFVTNYATTLGGGARAYGDGSISADTVIFDGNEAGEQGGGLYMDSSDFLGVSVDIYDNVADQGGGCYIADGLLYLSGGQVTGNTAYTGGGGAWLLDGELEASRSDWGTSSLDNDPDDVYIEAADVSYDAYGSSASFVCDAGGC